MMASILTWAGWNDVRQELLGQAAAVAVERDGAASAEPDGVFFGVGLLAMGLMLLTWGISFFVYTGKDRPEVAPRFGRGLGWISLSSLLLASACFSPPWKTQGLAFSMSGGTVLAFILAPAGSAGRRFARKLFPVPIAGAVLIAYKFNKEFPAPISFGLFAGLIVTIHLFLLNERISTLNSETT
jgi:xanthine/uracil permease